MSKSDAKLERISLRKVFQHQQDAHWAKGKQINAFDTETFKGTVFMLSYAIAEDSGVEHKGYIGQLDSATILDYLTDYRCRSAINVWYNLDFDANAILSGILNERQLTELVTTNQTATTVDGITYDISYVKGKFLHISDEHRNNYSHYDISQFFYTSLDNASKEWLDKQKIDEIDTSQFDNPEYIMENYDKIVEYAEKDATLTKELAQELIYTAEDLDIPMGKPFSTGYLSAEYLRANTEDKPGFGSNSYQDLFWQSYYGGRFEVFKRGNVGDVVAPDINSAYPAIMKDLPDPSTLQWEHYQSKDESGFVDTQQCDFEDICNADYGVVRVIVSTDARNPIQPFAHKIDGKVHFPVLTETEISVIKPIFEFAVKNDLVTRFRIKEAWLGYENEDAEYPFDFIGDLYGERKLFEKNNYYRKGKLLKIVLNSLYGKTCQTTESKQLLELNEEGYELDKYEKPLPKQFLSINQRSQLRDNEIIISRLESGRRFNPFIASYITGMTRLELHKRVVEYDLVEDTVMFATDCLMVDKEAYEKSDFDELIHTPNEDLEGDAFMENAAETLGMWDFDYQGEAFIVGSGVYEVDMKECQKRECDNYGSWCDNESHRTKTKTRGFTEKTLDITLKKSARKHNEGIPIETNRPLTISEVLISPERGSVSEFIEDKKKLTAGFDDKRNWQRDRVTFRQLLHSAEESRPIDLANRQEQLIKETQEETRINKKLDEFQVKSSDLETEWLLEQKSVSD